MNRKVGHRFHPTDEEIINHFLKKKVLGDISEVDTDIAEVELCQWEPWELPNRAVNKFDDDPLWFFFCKRVNKYNNSQRAKRTTKKGYWKATGKDRKIWTKKGTKQEIGIKKTLVFYKGRHPSGVRTNWVIHEYHPTAPDFPKQRAYVVCRLKKKPDDKADNSIPDEGESSCHEHFGYGSISEITTPKENSLLLSNGCLDYDSPSALQSQLHMEQGQNLNELPYYVDSSKQLNLESLFNNGCLNYVSPSALQSQLHMEQDQNLNELPYYVDSSKQEAEDFFNSIIVDPYEETVHTHLNGSNPLKSLEKVYVEDSSGTDAESFLARGKIYSPTAVGAFLQ